MIVINRTYNAGFLRQRLHGRGQERTKTTSQICESLMTPERQSSQVS